jgi:hypothetical protein
MMSGQLMSEADGSNFPFSVQEDMVRQAAVYRCMPLVTGRLWFDDNESVIMLCLSQVTKFVNYRVQRLNLYSSTCTDPDVYA